MDPPEQINPAKSNPNPNPDPTPPTTAGAPPAPARRHTLPKSHHLRLPREFDAVYAAKTRESRGPVTVYAKPNDLGHPRLGLSVSRKVGKAVRRNRIRRRLREAFRLMQHDFPRGYDLVIVVRPHPPLLLADYQRALSGAVAKLHNVWSRRGEAGQAGGGKGEEVGRRNGG